MTSTHGLFRDHPLPSKVVLLDWLKEERAYFHPGVRIEDIPNAGWGLVTETSLEPHELVFNIPITAIFSARTSSLALPSQSYKSTSGPILDLTLCLLHELRLERESRWYGYLQSLPRETILLPALWEVKELCGEDGAEGLEWLRGTEADRDLISKSNDGFSLADLEAYYTSQLPLLPATQAHPQPSPFLAYLHAFSLITTRAFLIDLYHTIALVPFADILNHSSTSPHTSLSSDSFVCHICGSLAPCEHDILAPDGIPFRLQEASRDSEDYKRMIHQENTVEMRMEAQVQPGEELFNSYGANISDARLLVEWGYLGEEYAGNGITWDRDSLGGNDSDRRAWLNILPYRRLWTLSHGDPIDPEGGRIEDELDNPPEDRLLFDSTLDSRGADLFNLSQAGQISTNVWVYLFLSSAEAGVDEPRDVIARLRQSIWNVEKYWEALLAQGTDDLSMEELATAERIRRLLQDRLGSLRGAEWSLDELFEIRDNLPPESCLQRMALSLCINERTLLETALSKWQELLESDPCP